MRNKTSEWLAFFPSPTYFGRRSFGCCKKKTRKKEKAFGTFKNLSEKRKVFD